MKKFGFLIVLIALCAMSGAALADGTNEIGDLSFDIVISHDSKLVSVDVSFDGTTNGWNNHRGVVSLDAPQAIGNNLTWAMRIPMGYAFKLTITSPDASKRPEDHQVSLDISGGDTLHTIYFDSPSSRDIWVRFKGDYDFGEGTESLIPYFALSFNVRSADSGGSSKLVHFTTSVTWLNPFVGTKLNTESQIAVGQAVPFNVASIDYVGRRFDAKVAPKVVSFVLKNRHSAPFDFPNFVCVFDPTTQKVSFDGFLREKTESFDATVGIKFTGMDGAERLISMDIPEYGVTFKGVVQYGVSSDSSEANPKTVYNGGNGPVYFRVWTSPDIGGVRRYVDSIDISIVSSEGAGSADVEKQNLNIAHNGEGLLSLAGKEDGLATLLIRVVDPLQKGGAMYSSGDVKIFIDVTSTNPPPPPPPNPGGGGGGGGGGVVPIPPVPNPTDPVKPSDIEKGLEESQKSVTTPGAEFVNATETAKIISANPELLALHNAGELVGEPIVPKMSESKPVIAVTANTAGSVGLMTQFGADMTGATFPEGVAVITPVLAQLKADTSGADGQQFARIDLSFPKDQRDALTAAGNGGEIFEMVFVIKLSPSTTGVYKGNENLVRRGRAEVEAGAIHLKVTNNPSEKNALKFSELGGTVFDVKKKDTMVAESLVRIKSGSYDLNDLYSAELDDIQDEKIDDYKLEIAKLTPPSAITEESLQAIIDTVNTPTPVPEPDPGKSSSSGGCSAGFFPFAPFALLFAVPLILRKKK